MTNKINQIPVERPHLIDERLEEVGLVPQGVVDQSVAEGHDAVGEVVLREPGHHALLLHVRAACHVHNQVAQVLPISARSDKKVQCDFMAWNK